MYRIFIITIIFFINSELKIAVQQFCVVVAEQA